MAVGFGVITIVAGVVGHWNPLLPLLSGGATVAFGIVALNSFRSQTIVSDSGVRPSGPGSEVVPWPEIAGFRLVNRDRQVGGLPHQDREPPPA